MFAIAAHPGSQQPQIIDAPEPREPHGTEVLCRTLQLGVCGTDRDILFSAQPMTPPREDFLILGHECLGQIEAMGDEVTGFQTGDLVVPVVRRALDARVRRPDLLPFGSYVERGIVREHGFSATCWIDKPQYLHKVSEQIAPIAVLAEPMSVAEKGINEATAIQRGRLGEGAWSSRAPRVLVTGLGPIGFTAAVACRCRDWPVTVYGRDPDDSFRAELALSLGANYVAADQFTASPADLERDGFDLILECTGSAQVMIHVAQSLASCGVLAWLGSSRSPEPSLLEMERLMRQGVLGNHVHIGSVNAAPRDFVQALEDLERAWCVHAETIESLITQRIAPHESLGFYTQRPSQSIKTVLMYA